MHKKEHHHKIKEKKPGHVAKYKKGGAIKEPEGDAPMKKGGACKKKGGKIAHAEGHHSKHRLDKRARGGKIMTPSSPMSGAMPKEQRPGFGKSKVDKSDD